MMGTESIDAGMTVPLNIGDLPRGIYFLNMTDSGGNFFNTKFTAIK
jgi:hypothetical protein